MYPKASSDSSATLASIRQSFSETIYAFPPPLEVSDDEANLAIQHALSSRRPEIPLHLYIHVPFCRTLCQFCGFIKEQIKSKGHLAEYVDVLLQEIALVCGKLSPETRIASIYFGGGTASLLSADDIRLILHALESRFQLEPGCELSFEGDASSLSRENYISKIKHLGFTRLSFGVQVINPQYRKLLNLIPSKQLLAEVAREGNAFFSEVACDYIYGLPGSSCNFLEDDVKEFVSELKCNVVEAFQLEHLDASPSFISSLPDLGLRLLSFEEQASQYKALVAVLKSEGYNRVTYTLFTRDTKSSLKYYSSYYGWSGDLIGLGRGAQSFCNGLMWGNDHNPAEYNVSVSKYRFPSASIATYEEGTRELVTWPRRGHISKLVVTARGSEDYLRKLQKIANEGLLRETSLNYELTADGWSQVPILMQFLTPAAVQDRNKEISGFRQSRIKNKL